MSRLASHVLYGDLPSVSKCAIWYFNRISKDMLLNDECVVKRSHGIVSIELPDNDAIRPGSINECIALRSYMVVALSQRCFCS